MDTKDPTGDTQGKKHIDVDREFEENKVKFQPFSSIIDPSFWKKLTDVKLNQMKLNEGPIDIYATFTDTLKSGLPCLATLNHASFDLNQILESKRATDSLLYGELLCLNSIERFQELDKKSMLSNQGEKIYDSIHDSDRAKDVTKKISKFILIVYADLKKYNFYYWFAFPSLNSPLNVRYYSLSGEETKILKIDEVFQVESLDKIYPKLSDLEEFNESYFVTESEPESGSKKLNFKSILTLSQFQRFISEDEYSEKILYHLSNNYSNKKIFLFAYLDPSSDFDHPGWSLRNFLYWIVNTCKNDQKFSIIRLRRNETLRSLSESLVMNLTFDLESVNNSEDLDEKLQKCTIEKKIPAISGWERNERGQLAPRRVCLANQLDPQRIAQDAVNLNLKLMRWRIVPDLNLEEISETRCLLLGAGTLGCHVARALLAWGVITITFVDNSKVSYSNPVRQSLYAFSDCLQGGKNKAQAASDSLKKIYPCVNSTGVCLSIPMPGHVIQMDNERQVTDTNRDVEKLEKLIEAHDVVFLLMDTRESRWLPTLIAATKQKLVINAAIGFDTFLLQRHGIRTSTSDGEESLQADFLTTRQTQLVESNQLGCYFCNDVVVPGDSTIDRSLDQQCTVSRPGVSMWVSALAVELMVSCLAHKLKFHAPASTNYTEQNKSSLSAINENESILGVVPHSIRGSISNFNMYMPTTPAFSKCSACSYAVIQEYKRHGFAFLLKVFNDPDYLEKIAGLKDLQCIDDDAVLALSSSDDGD